MSYTTNRNGRLCNQIIRNIATSFVAEKHDLFVNYASGSLISNLGIKLFSGKNKYSVTKKITDQNYFDILNCDSINYNINPNYNYFQSKEISSLITKWLLLNKECIINANPFRERYNNNNSIFIHVRLGDVISKNPGFEYYKKVIDLIKNKNQIDDIFVSSDSPNHSIVKSLVNKYNVKIFNRNEIETIQFGSTCKYVILSHGSFSAFIGWISFFSEIYYKKLDLNKMWHGDMYTINDWNEIEI